MTDSFVTQCPHCQTSFRVNHAQLSVARGVVRCGSCLQVFNAAKQLLEQHSGKDTVTPAAPPTVEAAPQPLIARTRSGPVKVARITDMAAGLSMAAPAPWSSRAQMSVTSSAARASSAGWPTC